MPVERTKWKGLLKIMGPIFFIFLFVKVVDFKATTSLLKGVDLQMALSTIVLFPLVNAALTVRWWFICRHLKIFLRFASLFQIYYISWFLSAFPILGLSPLAKLIYLKEEGKPVGISAVTITLDKLFDIIGLILFGFFGLVYFPTSFFIDSNFWIFVGGILVLVVIILGFGSKIWKITKTFLRRYTNKKLQKFGHKFETDLAEFYSDFSLKSLLPIIGISIVIGLLRSAVLYVLALTLNIPVSFGFMVACRALIGIVNVIPVSISGLGTRDAVLLVTLPLLGVSKEAAIALGFLAFLWTLLSKFSGFVFWLKRPLPSDSILSLKQKLVS